MNVPVGTDGVRQSLASFRSGARGRLEGVRGAAGPRRKTLAQSALSEEELLSLPLLYRSALSSLSVARATSLDNALVAYLESLCLRGYFYLYGARRGLGSASAISSSTTGRAPSATCGARRWYRSG